MGFTETATSFPCGAERLVGVLSLPEQPRATGLVIVVGGPQYRAGSHRQFVLLARFLATAGFPVLRFDYSGMGDSSGRTRDFQSVQPDIEAALGILKQACPAVRQVALWGLCDAASAALLYCAEPGRSPVDALCLLNPWVRSEQSYAQAQVRYYYVNRLFQRDFWLKLCRGGVSLMRVAREGARTLQESMKSGKSEQGGFQERMFEVLSTWEKKALIILSGQDLTAREFSSFVDARGGWRRLLEAGRVRRLDVPEADHTFSTMQWRAEVEKATLKFLEELESPCAAS